MSGEESLMSLAVRWSRSVGFLRLEKVDMTSLSSSSTSTPNQVFLLEYTLSVSWSIVVSLMVLVGLFKHGKLDRERS